MPLGINLIKAPEDPTDIVLGLDRDGNYFINTHPIGRNQPHDVVLRQAEDSLRNIYARWHTSDRILFLKAHQSLKMEKVQEAVALARRAGVRVIAAETQQRLGTEPTVSQERGN